VSQRPASPVPLIVRASLHYDLGFAARGTKFASETSEKQFAGMRKHFELAIRDAVASRERAPVHMVAAGTVLLIARATSGTEQAKPWVDAVLQANPLNFGMRRRLIDAMEPRWGGSLEAMEQLAHEAQVFADRNPRIRVLLGIPHAYRGLEAQWAKQPQKVVQHYSEALAYGDRGVEWSLARGWAYTKLGQRGHARADVAYAKLWKPEEAEVWQLSGKILIEEQIWDRAVAELDRAVELAPTNALSRSYRGWAHENLRHWKQAEADYRAALEIERDAWRASHLGKVLFRGLGETKDAISWLQLAARLNGDDADNWFELAQA
jgi:tetratricopeptide (TPR) repeat protein